MKAKLCRKPLNRRRSIEECAVLRTLFGGLSAHESKNGAAERFFSADSPRELGGALVSAFVSVGGRALFGTTELGRIRQSKSQFSIEFWARFAGLAALIL